MTIRHNIPPEVLAAMSDEQRAALDNPAIEAMQDRVNVAYRDLVIVARHALALRESDSAEFIAHTNALHDMALALGHQELAIVAAFALADCARFARACAEHGIEDIR